MASAEGLAVKIHVDSAGQAVRDWQAMIEKAFARELAKRLIDDPISAQLINQAGFTQQDYQPYRALDAEDKINAIGQAPHNPANGIHSDTPPPREKAKVERPNDIITSERLARNGWVWSVEVRRDGIRKERRLERVKTADVVL